MTSGMFRGRITAENQLDMFLCCRFLLRPPQFSWISFCFFFLFFPACHFDCLYFFPLGNNSNPFFRFLHFYFYHIYFLSRKQITEDDKAMEASVVLSLPVNDAYFSQTHFYDDRIYCGLKNTLNWMHSCEYTVCTDALYNLIHCGNEL